MSAFIVFAERGEYSDHTFQVLCVAKTEAEARAAVQHFAAKHKHPWLDAAKTMARAVIEDDDWPVNDGWLVGWEADNDGEFPSNANPYNSTLYGFQRVDVWGDAEMRS